MYRRYYSYNDMPQILKHTEEVKKTEPPKDDCCEKPCPPPQGNKLFGNFETDDIILGIVILALLLDGNDDKILLLALAVIFLTT